MFKNILRKLSLSPVTHTTILALIVVGGQMVFGCQSPAPKASTKAEVVKFVGTDPSPEELARRKAAYDAAMKNAPGQVQVPTGPSASQIQARQKFEGAKTP